MLLLLSLYTLLSSVPTILWGTVFDSGPGLKLRASAFLRECIRVSLDSYENDMGAVFLCLTLSNSYR